MLPMFVNMLNIKLISFLLVAYVLLGIKAGAQNDFILGADLSYANMMEDCGAEFREDGQIKDVYQIFADNGTNLVRVRLWHNPSWQEELNQPDGVKAQYSNYDDVEETIFRAKLAGMQVMLGFQFSDFWCDPGRQILPKAWEAVANNLAVLSDSVYNYVYSTLTKLNSQGLMPEYVKIGNENNSGIMTHMGMNSAYEGINALSSSWSRHAKLYNAAINAVRDISETSDIKPKIALHVADPSNANWFYGNLIANGVTQFDIIGFTYYYAYHGQFPAEVGQIIQSLKKTYINYEVMVVETGYLWDTQNIDGLGNIINQSCPGYQTASPAMQQKFMVDLSREVKDAGGLGLIFWEPDWVSTPCVTPWGVGSSQEHVAFFDHRNNLNFMKNGGGAWPNAFINGHTSSKVNVTFKVDMSDIDINNGVFIVGQMTNWDFVEMDAAENSVYSTTFELIPGDVFAYYYITNNSWDNYEAYRETVPEACANSDELLNDPDWTTDRAFIVPQTDTLIANVWASCQTINSISVLNQSNGIQIYPNPVIGNSIIVESFNNEKIESICLLNSMGQIQHVVCINKQGDALFQIDLHDLQKGVYLLQAIINKGVFSRKIIIE